MDIEGSQEERGEPGTGRENGEREWSHVEGLEKEERWEPGETGVGRGNRGREGSKGEGWEEEEGRGEKERDGSILVIKFSARRALVKICYCSLHCFKIKLKYSKSLAAQQLILFLQT